MINRILLFVSLLAVSSFSFSAPGIPQTRYAGNHLSGGATLWMATKIEACDALWTKFKSTPYGSSFTVHSFNTSNNNCYAGTVSNPTYENIGPVSTSVRCPADWSTTPVNGLCGEPCPRGLMAETKVEMVDGLNGKFLRPTSFGGCEVEIYNIIKCWKYLDTGTKSCSIEFYRTGLLASVSDQASTVDGSSSTKTPLPVIKTSAPPSGSCPGGTVNAGIDSAGIPICIGSGTNPATSGTSQPVTSKPASTVANADGSSTVTKETSSVNLDGSTTVVKVISTTMSDGSITTKTDVATSIIPVGKLGAGRDGVPTNGSPGPAGAAGTGTNGTNGTNGKDAVSMCSENPNLSICRNSSVTGSCSAVACDGDAIQCATLRAAAAIQCKQVADDDLLKASPLNGLGSAGVAGNDPLKSQFPTIAGATVVQTPNSLDSSGWLGNGACFSDKSFNIQGHTVTIPLSQSCDYLLIFRYALMVVAGLMSFKLLSGAILT